MNAVEANAIISSLREDSQTCAQHDMEIPAANHSGHPFGSVLLRLQLALALIYASRKHAAPVAAGPGRKRPNRGVGIA